MEDRSGQPRRKEDIVEAIQAVEGSIVKHMLKLPPELALVMPIIREGLIELLKRREIDEIPG